MSDLVIKSNEAKLQMGSLKKAVEAKPAVAAVKAVKAVAEVKDGDKVTTAGVKAIAAVAAVPATKAVPAVLRINLLGINDGVMGEVMARMAKRGFKLADAEAPVTCDYGYTVQYRIDPTKQGDFRKAFKGVKGADNAAGLAIAKKAADKVKAEEKAAKKKEVDEAKAAAKKEADEAAAKDKE